MEMFREGIRNKIEYRCVVRSPSKRVEIDEWERTQEHFMSEDQGIEHMKY